MNVLITGAGRGLGLDLARIHARRGDHVYALAHSLTEELGETASTHGNITVFTVELTDDDAVRTILEGIKEASVDTVYNVAGIWYPDQRTGIADTDLDKMAKLYRVNAIAPVRVMKYGKRLLKDDGILLNVSSEAGSIGECWRDNDYGYCMSKAALNMASMIFQNETRERGIRVYCYHPGWMRTRMGGERAAASPESISPEEAAEALVSLLYEENEKISGMFFDYRNKKWEW